MRKLDLVGERYGRLTVIKRVQGMRQGHVMWVCRCDCDAGEKKRKRVIVNHSNLRAGKTRSCGCLATERAKPQTPPRFSRRRLSAEQVGEICRLGFEEGCTFADIATRIGVSVTSVFKVLNGFSHQEKTEHWLALYRGHSLYSTHRQREAGLNTLEGYNPLRIGSARNNRNT